MALTVATVINNARDLHPALSVSNAPVPIALRALARIQRGIVRDITSRIPAWLALEVTVPFPLADFDAGIDLTTLIPNGWQDLTDGFIKYANAPNDKKSKIQFVPWEQRDLQRTGPAYTFRSQVLYFLGGPQRYASVAAFYLTYTGIAPNIATINDLIVLTDDSLDALAALLAAVWLQRMVGIPSLGVDADTAGQYSADAAAERAAYLTRVLSLGQRQTYRVRDTQARGNPF